MNEITKQEPIRTPVAKNQFSYYLKSRKLIKYIKNNPSDNPRKYESIILDCTNKSLDMFYDRLTENPSIDVDDLMLYGK